MNTPSNDPHKQSETPAPEVSAPVLREASEPTEKSSPLPFWLVIFAGILVFWGGFHLASNSGGFKADVYNPEITGAAAGPAAPPDPKVIGKRLFTLPATAVASKPMSIIPKSPVPLLAPLLRPIPKSSASVFSPKTAPSATKAAEWVSLANSRLSSPANGSSAVTGWGTTTL